MAHTRDHWPQRIQVCTDSRPGGHYLAHSLSDCGIWCTQTASLGCLQTCQPDTAHRHHRDTSPPLHIDILGHTDSQCEGRCTNLNDPDNSHSEWRRTCWKRFPTSSCNTARLMSTGRAGSWCKLAPVQCLYGQTCHHTSSHLHGHCPHLTTSRAHTDSIRWLEWHLNTCCLGMQHKLLTR